MARNLIHEDAQSKFVIYRCNAHHRRGMARSERMGTRRTTARHQRWMLVLIVDFPSSEKSKFGCAMPENGRNLDSLPAPG
jgi:hypothetical protein